MTIYGSPRPSADPYGPPTPRRGGGHRAPDTYPPPGQPSVAPPHHVPPPHRAPQRPVPPPYRAPYRAAARPIPPQPRVATAQPERHSGTGPSAPRRVRPGESRFRPDIEGMRAIAVLAVVAYHAGIHFVGGGYVGVDVFFVISGFLITTHLYRELERTGRLSFGAFYARRMLRLLPASSLVVVATVIVSWLCISPLLVKRVTVDALTAVGYCINIRLAMQGTDYLSAEQEPSPLQHFWSLAVEEQFYFVWPAVLLVASAVWLRRGRPSRASAATVLALLAAGSLAVCVWQTRHSQPWAYFGIQARAFELAAGALVALVATSLVRMHPVVAGALGWLGLGAIVASIGLYTDDTVFPGVAATLPVAGAALVIASGCAQRARVVQAVLGVRPMQWIGRLSYSWYLWHWPVLTLAPHVAGHKLSLWINVGLAAASALPAWLSMRLVENPIRFHQVFRQRPRAGLVLGSAFTCISVGAGILLAGAPLRVPTSGTGQQTANIFASATPAPQESASPGPDPRARLLELIRASAMLKAVPDNLVPALAAATSDGPHSNGCLAGRTETSTARAMSAGCGQHGDSGATTTVVLFGDSHAEQWFQAVREIAQARHWRLVVLNKAACSPALAFTTNTASGGVYRECASWREDALRTIGQLKPAIVIMTGRNYKEVPTDERGSPLAGPADNNWAKATAATATRIRQLGARPVFVQDSPDPNGVDVPVCLAGHPTAVTQCALKVTTALKNSRRAAIAAALAAADVKVIEPADWFCTTTVCPSIIGNILVYRDGSHVTSTYVKLLTPLLQAELQDPGGA